LLTYHLSTVAYDFRFRKGTIPPFILKDINEFVLREAIGDEINAACDELNLKPLEGEASEPNLDFKELYARFKVGEDYTFGCDIALKSEATAEEGSSETEGAVVVDARAEPASTE
jgi:hypothetical protein